MFRRCVTFIFVFPFRIGILSFHSLVQNIHGLSSCGCQVIDGFLLIFDRYCCHFMHPPIHMSACQVCPSQTTLRIKICLKFGWCSVAWSRLLLKMALPGQLMYIPQNFEIFHYRLGPGLREDVTVVTLEEFWVSTWNLVERCILSWSISLFRMVLLS